MVVFGIMTEKPLVFQIERLIWAREKMGISQTELARRLGIRLTHYNGFELGRHQPSLDMVIKLSRILDISIDYLVGSTDKPEGEPPKILPPEQEALLRIERAELEIAKAKKAIKKTIEGKRDHS